jgi:GAF domain
MHFAPNAATYDAMFLLWGVILGMIIGGALVSRWKYKAENSVNAMLAAILLGGIGLVGHVLLVTRTNQAPWLPLFDTTTLWWAGLIVVGIAVPVISEVTFGGVSLKLKIAEKIALKATDLLQMWMYTTRDFMQRLESPDITPEKAGEELKQFISLRSFEALKWIGQDDELRRLSIWLYDQDIDRITFFCSNQIRDKNTVDFKFEVGKGIIGIIFKNQETWNESDAAEIPGWIDITGAEPRYRGLYCQPITYGETHLGVLSVDREKRERFDTDDENILAGFAYMMGIVLGNEKTREKLTG